MKTWCRKILRVVAVCSAFLFFAFSAQAQLTIGTVDPGPYGAGSNITVPISFPNNISDLPIDSKFEIFLSNENGIFAGNGTLLGTFNGFYAPAVNGIIPASVTIPGANYKLRVRISNPGNNPAAAVLDVATPITIVAQPAPPVTLTPNSLSNALGGDNIGFCTSEAGANKSIILRDNLPATSIVEVTVRNLVTNATTVYPEIPFSGSTGYNITGLATGYYSVTATATTVVNGITIKSVKTYTLHNTILGLGISDSGVSVGCINVAGGGASVSYGITSIAGNYPGTTYRINWGDGKTGELTYAEVMASSSSVFHTYTETSCGRGGSPDGSNNNSFQATITAVSTVCATTKPITVYAQVLLNPIAKISGSSIGCTNVAMSFTNSSTGGTRSDCSGQMDYTWYVDSDPIPVLSTSTTEPLVWTFTTPGQHTVRLVASNGSSACVPSEDIFNVCVQIPPVPAFMLSETTTCLSSTVTANSSTTVLHNTCGSTPVYTWTVTPAAGVTFTQGSANPNFKFPATGIYTIALAIQTGFCSAVSVLQTVTVNSDPQIAMSRPAQFCTKGRTLVFGGAAGPTQTIVSGTTTALADTYTWSVAGPAIPTFVNGTGPHSKEPEITFPDYGAYTVTLIHKNNCGTKTESQNISFSQSPEPVVTLPANACYNTAIPVQGTITNGTFVSFAWTSNIAGTFSNPSGTFADQSALNTTFTPTDLTKTSAIITLTVNTGIPGNCAVVADAKTVTISPNNTGTSTVLEICTGSPLAYTPASSIAGSAFRWTATYADGNAQAGTYPTSGTDNINATAIVNTSATVRAQIIYTIIPESINGSITCDGVPYTLTVNVNPLPVLTATATQSPICSGSPAGITLTSNLETPTKYTWTTSVTGGTVTGAPPQTTPIATTSISNNLRNQGTATATLTYTITPYSASGCPGVPVNVSVQVDPELTTPIAGQDENICNSTTFTLKGNPITVGTGTWTLTPAQSGETIVNPNSNNAFVSGLVPGETYVFRWTVIGGSCQPLTDEMSLYVNIPTVPGTTSTNDQLPVCASSNTGTVTLSGNLGNVTRWQSSVDGGAIWQDIANTTATLTYTNITVTTQYRAGVKNGDCLEEFSTPTTITVVPATTIANAGTDQVLCNGTSAQLNALSTLKAGETGRWTMVSPISSNAKISNLTNPATTVTDLEPGQTYIFTWTITGLSPCGPTQANLRITNLPPLTNTISSTSVEACYKELITITGDTPTGGNGTYAYQWQVSADGTTWSDISGQTSKDLNIQITASSSYRRVVNSNPCTLTSEAIKITVLQIIGNNNIITADQTICSGTAPLALNGTVPINGNGTYFYQWESSSDNGNTWINVDGATELNFTPPIPTATILYRRLVASGTCSDLSNSVKITVNPPAKAEFTFTVDKGCPPFTLTPAIIKAIPYPDRNGTYTWFADGNPIGTGINFPGYTITEENRSVVIKLVVTSSLGCNSGEFSHTFSTQQNVIAAFTQSATQGCGPLTVNFTNTSNSLTESSFKWDFGNGTTSNQAQPGPVTFQSDPTGKDITYTITLSAITPCGTTTKTATVFVQGEPKSIFSPDKTTGCSPLTVNFSNTSPESSGTTYTFDFNDGSPLLVTNNRNSVSHLFTTLAVRDYVVTMTAENACGKSSSSYTLRVAPNDITPELVVNAGELSGCAPFTVNFYNNTKGASRFAYDFGDETGLQITNSAPETVSHIFTKPGTYTVTLYATNDCSNAQTTETITVLTQPTVEFTADKTAICDGGLVKFRNTSKNAIGYAWDFGDGTTSFAFEPEHVYTGAGQNFTVKLTTTNALGCTNTLILTDYIKIAPELKSIFTVLPGNELSIPNFTFSFRDASLNGAGSWEWNFGDGTVSTLQNPTHTYANVGDYTVTLKVLNKEGCSATSSQAVRIIGVPGFLYVPNSFMPGSAKNELQTFKAKGRGIYNWTMTIFNKWGQVLWETTKLDDGAPLESWDGTYKGQPQPQGVYFWKIEVKFINGSEWKGMTYDSSPPKKTGNIYLIR